MRATMGMFASCAAAVIMGCVFYSFSGDAVGSAFGGLMLSFLSSLGGGLIGFSASEEDW